MIVALPRTVDNLLRWSLWWTTYVRPVIAKLPALPVLSGETWQLTLLICGLLLLVSESALGRKIVAVLRREKPQATPLDLLTQLENLIGNAYTEVQIGWKNLHRGGQAMGLAEQSVKALNGFFRANESSFNQAERSQIHKCIVSLDLAVDTFKTAAILGILSADGGHAYRQASDTYWPKFLALREQIIRDISERRRRKN